MSAEFSSPIPVSTPDLVLLPPAAPVPVVETPASTLPPAIQALARNPIVLAGGAVLIGVVLSRFMATPSAKKFARELAAEALKQLKPAAAGAAGMAGTAAVGSLLEMGVEKYGPQISDFAKKMLAEMLRKKE